MLKHNLGLLAGSAVLFAGSVAVAAMSFDGAPARDSNSTMTRKNGDMLVYYHGGSYRALSSRRGSVHSRSVMGGGLRGGK